MPLFKLTCKHCKRSVFMDYPSEPVLREYMRTRWSCPAGSVHGEVNLYRKIVIKEVADDGKRNGGA